MFVQMVQLELPSVCQSWLPMICTDLCSMFRNDQTLGFGVHFQGPNELQIVEMGNRKLYSSHLNVDLHGLEEPGISPVKSGVLKQEFTLENGSIFNHYIA